MSAEQLDRRSLREELLDIVTALWFEIDHREGRRAASFFVSDAELRIFTQTFRGTAEIEEIYTQRAANGPRVTRHVVTNMHITSAETDRASAVAIVTLFAEDGDAPRPTVTPTLVADVADVFERHGGGWLIRSRRIEPLFIAPATVLPVPTE